MEAKELIHENELERGSEHLKSVMDSAGQKLSGIRLSSIKTKLSGLPQNVKEGLTGGIRKKVGQTKDLINSVKDKNERMRNLEKLLRIDGEEIISSSKKNRIYKSENGKLTIIDKDFWEEPSTVTIKHNDSVSIKKVKFLEDKPFLFPVFSEKNIKGQEIYMENNEIWYKDRGLITIVQFKSEKPEYIRIELDESMFKKNEEVIEYLKMYLSIFRNSRISSLLKEEGIDANEVVKVGKNHMIAKKKDSFLAYYTGEDGEFSDVVELKSIPELDDRGLETLFSQEIGALAIKNGCRLEEFVQNGEFIEYWQEIGSRKVCLLRCKC
ncbi:MAG: hypothetical protein N2484_14855 [Clostridia bacterium]|nr:hypothetical protein [Clostridia bacterium]